MGKRKPKKIIIDTPKRKKEEPKEEKSDVQKKEELKEEKKVPTRNLKFTKKEDMILPPGQYYIGDTCFRVDEDVMQDLQKVANYKEGAYICENGSGIMFLNTECGDGYYYDSNRIGYIVNGGNIGVVPLEFATRVKDSKLYTFEQEVAMNKSNGIIQITSGDQTITIDTKLVYNDPCVLQ